MYNRTADKIIDFFRESSRTILGFVDSVDLTFIGTVTRLAPIVAPAPAAYSVYRAMVAINTPQWVAILTAVTVELIGMFQSKTALRARNWNLIKLKSDPAAPFDLALFMALIYFIVALGLTTIIEFAPSWAHIIYPAFVVFAASVYVSNAIASDLTRWEVDRADRLREQATRTGLKADIKQLSGQHDRLTEKVKKLAFEAAQLDKAISTKQHALATLNGQNTGTQASTENGNRNGNGDRSALTTDQTRAIAMQFMAAAYREGREPTGSEVGKYLGRSDSLGRKLKRELWAQVTNGQNGTNRHGGEQ